MHRLIQPRKTREVPDILRCCGYWSRRQQRWIGYCLELQVRAEAPSWEDLLTRLTMGASLHLAHLEQNPSVERTRLAPFRIRLIYAGIALMHFVRPRKHWGLADLPRRLLVNDA